MSNGRRERTCGDARGAVVSACLPMSNGRAVRPFRRAGALMREAISMMREANARARCRRGRWRPDEGGNQHDEGGKSREPVATAAGSVLKLLIEVVEERWGVLVCWGPRWGPRGGRLDWVSVRVVPV